MRAVDYVSMHTYPYHNTHYNPEFWGITDAEAGLSDTAAIRAAMQRAVGFARGQYQSVVEYVHRVDPSKPVHIGETGWASHSSGLYGPEGSKASDEYKQALYHRYMRAWTKETGIACFYFEAFDEAWKAAGDPANAENHFGLFTVEGQAKYALWEFVGAGAFDGLGRGGIPVGRSYEGDRGSMMEEVQLPPRKSDLEEKDGV